MYQKIMIIGHLGRDPEMRYTPSGVPVTTLSVATNRNWTNADGTPGEETCWFRVSCWNRMAEVTNQYLKKGRMVMVEGTLSPDPATGGPKVWSRSDGTSGASFEIRATTVKFLGGNGESGAGGGATRQPRTEQDSEPGYEEGHDDLPF